MTARDDYPTPVKIHYLRAHLALARPTLPAERQSIPAFVRARGDEITERQSGNHRRPITAYGPAWSSGSKDDRVSPARDGLELPRVREAHAKGQP